MASPECQSWSGVSDARPKGKVLILTVVHSTRARQEFIGLL